MQVNRKKNFRFFLLFISKSVCQRSFALLCVGRNYLFGIYLVFIMCFPPIFATISRPGEGNRLLPLKREGRRGVYADRDDNVTVGFLSQFQPIPFFCLFLFGLSLYKFACLFYATLSFFYTSLCLFYIPCVFFTPTFPQKRHNLCFSCTLPCALLFLFDFFT